MIIALLYRMTYKGTSYSVSYSQSIVAFALITTVVIMVIGNNLARAFGLVGSMSIIRFRMAIKDTQDIVFIFFTLAIGMAAGVGQHSVAVTATLVIGMFILALSKTGFATMHKREYLLQFHFASDNAESIPYVDILKRFCRNYKLVNIKTIGDGGYVELSYYIVLKSVETAREMVTRIRGLDGAQNVNLFFDEE